MARPERFKRLVHLRVCLFYKTMFENRVYISITRDDDVCAPGGEPRAVTVTREGNTFPARSRARAVPALVPSVPAVVCPQQPHVSQPTSRRTTSTLLPTATLAKYSPLLLTC
jgi:hypothetical protein